MNSSEANDNKLYIIDIETVFVLRNFFDFKKRAHKIINIGSINRIIYLYYINNASKILHTVTHAAQISECNFHLKVLHLGVSLSFGFRSIQLSASFYIQPTL